MQDFLTGEGSEEELKLFRSQAVQYLKENPKASKQQVIDAGMTGMKRKVPAQGKSDAREAKAAEERQRMDTIGKQIRAAYPDQNFSDAQIEALVARELERIAVSEYNADDKLRTRTMR
jgi:hypothetical protein